MIQQLNSAIPVPRADRPLLLTGATGLVGRYLLRNLLLAGHPVVAVVRPGPHETARTRIERILQGWEAALDRPLPRPVVLAGDVRLPHLGLSPSERGWVKQHCRRAIHAAAVLRFSGDRKSEPWRTNVGGTRHVVRFCRSTRIRDLHFVSTAYVCGNRVGTILESELDAGQSFRNDYEQSKFTAEKLIREHWENEALTVYRPAVIIGDSVTGATSSYHGLFLYLRLLALLVPHQQRAADGTIVTPIHLPFTGDEPRNLVPVDWVAAMIARLVDHPQARGRTFHLAPDVGTTAKTIVDGCYAYFHSCGVSFADQPDAAHANRSAFAAQFFENTRIYRSYEQSDPQFDRSNLRTCLPEARCPVVDQAMIHRFLDFGERDRWGKSPPPSLPEPPAEGIELEVKRRAEITLQSARAVGFDVWGPWGGQWTARRRSDGKITLEPGLGSDLDPMATVTLHSAPTPAALSPGQPWPPASPVPALQPNG